MRDVKYKSQTKPYIVKTTQNVYLKLPNPPSFRWTVTFCPDAPRTHSFVDIPEIGV